MDLQSQAQGPKNSRPVLGNSLWSVLNTDSWHMMQQTPEHRHHVSDNHLGPKADN